MARRHYRFLYNKPMISSLDRQHPSVVVTFVVSLEGAGIATHTVPLVRTSIRNKTPAHFMWSVSIQHLVLVLKTKTRLYFSGTL